MPSSFELTLPDDILLDTAVLYYDPVTPGTMVKFGGTRGGLTFNRNRELRTVPVDGVTQAVRGIQRFIAGDATITGTVIVFGPDRLEVLEPGSTAAESGSNPNAILTVTPLESRTMIPSTAYHQWECLWKRGNGGTFKVVFPIGLAIIDSIGSQDNNEAESPITVTCIIDEADAASSDETPAGYYYEITGDDIVIGVS
jgi:hypothetical protein